MGTKQDAQAATDHYNYVKSQTNDVQQLADAKANMDRANGRHAANTSVTPPDPDKLREFVGDVAKNIKSKIGM